MLSNKKGFTLIEFIIVISIFAILCAVIIVSIRSVGDVKKVRSEAEIIVAVLNEAKSKSVSGNNASKYGVAFSTSTYVLFQGTSYVPNNPNNIIYSVNDGLILSNTISGSDDSIIFEKLNGNVSEEATITVSSSLSTSTDISVIINTLGVIDIVE